MGDVGGHGGCGETWGVRGDMGGEGTWGRMGGEGTRRDMGYCTLCPKKPTPSAGAGREEEVGREEGQK